MSNIDFKLLPTDGIKFEALIHHLLREMGYRIIEKPAVGTEGGRDILVERTLSDAMSERKERVVIQCKHFAGSGSNVSDRDVGVWQNVLSRYQARDYLLVTDTHVTENLSRSFREFTADELNSPRWADFWDVEQLTSLLQEHPKVRDVFFPPAKLAVSGFRQFVGDVRAWLTAIEYEVEEYEINRQEIELRSIIGVGALRIGIRVRCVDGEITQTRASDLLSALDQKYTQGWLISDSRVSPRAREIVSQNQLLRVFNFSEFLEAVIWGPYFQSLRLADKRDHVSTLYVDRGCFKLELDSSGEVCGRDNFPSLDLYADAWLKERGDSQIALLGDFGSGKSWFCRHYANRQLLRFLEDPSGERVPLLLPLREFRGMTAEQLITTALVQFYRLPFVGNAYEIFQNLSSQGRLLLLLDGFDEMSWRADRGELVQIVAEIRRLVASRNKLLLTSRTEFFRHAAESDNILGGGPAGGGSRDFELLYVQPLSNEEQRTALSKRVTSDAAARIADVLSAAPALAEMANKPIVIELITQLSEAESLQVGSAAAVYAFATNKLLLRNIASGGTFTSTRDKLIFLCELAWGMVCAGDLRVHYSDIPRSIRNHFAGQLLGKESIDIWDIDLRSQTLLHRDPGGYYEFSHRSLAEYFAALKLAAAIGEIDKQFLSAYQERGHQTALMPEPIAKLEDLVALLAIFPLTDRKMNAVTSFLKEILAPSSSHLLFRILRSGGDRGFAESNAATLLVQMNISLAKEDLSGKQLIGADLDGADLRSAICIGTNFTRARLSNAYLARADFRQAELRDVRIDHVSGVKALRFSEDGNHIVSGSSDGYVEAWNVRSGRSIFRIRAHPSSEFGNLCVASAPGTAFFATVGFDGWLRIWDMTGQALSALSAHGQMVSVDISPDGSRVAAMDWSTTTVTMWELNTGRRLHSFAPDSAEDRRAGYDVRFSPDGSYLAAAHLVNGAAIWDVSTGKIVAKLLRHTSKVESVTFAAGGRYVVTAGYDRILNVWDSSSWKFVCELQESAMIAEIAPSPTTDDLFTALHNGSVGVWDLTSMKRTKGFRAHRGSVYALAVASDGRRLASGGQDATITLREMAGKKVIDIDQALKCHGLDLRGVRGLRRDIRSILLARGAIDDAGGKAESNATKPAAPLAPANG